jgi:hypothetical protein
MRTHVSLVLVGVAALAAGCVYGPKQLEKGHLAYNHAVKSAADEELLLNIVRLRYADTLEFVSTSSISSSLSIGLTGGARGGTDTLSGTLGGLGYGEISYSTRPTFTFTPQRGSEFAEGLIKPVSLEIITYLVSSDWDVKMLFHLLVRRLNGVDNELGLPVRSGAVRRPARPDRLALAARPGHRAGVGGRRRRPQSAGPGTGSDLL